MITQKSENKLLASLAVFREIYNSQKDIYGVIASFLNDLIIKLNIFTFSLNEIHNLFNSFYEFDIPRAVIKSSLRRLEYLEKKDLYIVKDKQKLISENVDRKQEKVLLSNKLIIENLFKFIEKEKGITLSESEKEIILHNFCNFIIDESINDDYLEFITSYVIKNENDPNFINSLNLIREGVILYTGIKYNPDINDFGAWRSELTIFLDTEILFHIAGYNGELYQILALDLLKLIKEINQKAKKRLIKLKYFTETKKEIEDFFTKAKYLLEGKGIPNPKVTAMLSILNGCRTISDIVDKKTDFYLLLKKYHIEEDDYDKYFEPFNHKYNIISQDIIKKLNEEFGKDISDDIRLLNFVSIRRKENNHNNFENIGFILLTGNSTILRLAWNNFLKDKGNVPLATHLNFLTNKFWFKLNKGLGKNSLPKSVDVITKAQISLSSILNETVGEKYLELQKEFKEGKLNEEQVKARIINLRRYAHKPEDIKEENLNDILYLINEDNLEKFLEEQEHYKIKSEKQKEENEKLKTDLLYKEEEIKKSFREKEKLRSDLILTKKELLNEKEKLIDTLLKQKKPIDSEVRKKIKYFKFFLILIIIFLFVITYLITSQLGSDKLDKWSWIINVAVPILFSTIYMIWKEKTLKINPLKILKKRKEKIKQNIYKKYNFDIELLNKLEQEKNELLQEIEKLKNNYINNA